MINIINNTIYFIFGRIRSIWSYYFVSASKITNTQLNILNSFTVLHDEIGVICGEESEITKIKSYNLQTGRELNCLTSKDAWGLAEVKLGGKISLAVSNM